MGKQAYHPHRIIQGARDLLADAATRCHAPDRTDQDNVHEIRKDLKAVRAYWRLMRHALGKHPSQAGNERCKHAAKQLADARDHVVMLGTLDELGSDTGRKTALALGQVRQAMNAADDGTPADEIHWDKVAELIRHDDAAWSGLDPQAIDPADIKRGWAHTRKKARALFLHARTNAGSEALHDWRKWAKRWLQQEELLHPGRAKRIGRLGELADVLGLHHDLVVLAHRLRRSDRLGGPAQRRVHQSIAKRQGGLEKDALRLGKKVFA